MEKESGSLPRKDGKATLLHRVSRSDALFVTGTNGTQAVGDHAQGQQASHTLAQVECSIRRSTGIREGLAGLGKLIQKRGKVVCRTVSDEGELEAFGLDGRPGVHKASNLLAAKHSAEVSNENKDGWAILPEMKHRHGGAVGPKYCEVGKLSRHGAVQMVEGTPASSCVRAHSLSSVSVFTRVRGSR